MSQSIVDPKTLKWLVRFGIVAGALLVAIWLVGFLMETVRKGKKGGGGTKPKTNADGTPEPAGLGVDKAYIDRIAKIGQTLDADKSYEGLDGDRCEFINNVAGMRDEEILALITLTSTQYGYDARALVNKCQSNGCLSWGNKTLDQAKQRMRNF